MIIPNIWKNKNVPTGLEHFFIRLAFAIGSHMYIYCQRDINQLRQLGTILGSTSFRCERMLAISTAANPGALKGSDLKWVWSKNVSEQHNSTSPAASKHVFKSTTRSTTDDHRSKTYGGHLGRSSAESTCIKTWTALIYHLKNIKLLIEKQSVKKHSIMPSK